MIHSSWAGAAATAALLTLSAVAQTPAPARVMTQGAHRMELTLERLENGSWHIIDPGLVLASGDRVRFRFRTNFDGYLYVTNHNTSGSYEQLFPRQETGRENYFQSNRDYQVPATAATAFRVAGPAGYEIVYWLVSPVPLNEAVPGFQPLPPNYKTPHPLTLTPRCDDQILRARGTCVDGDAGPKLVPRGSEDVPQALGQAAEQGSGDLLFMRQQNKSVISSPSPLTGPVIYEFRLAHK